MRIRVKADGKVFSGTPVEIVHRMMKRDFFREYSGLDDYVEEAVKRLQAEAGSRVQVRGDSIDDKCLCFLAELLRSGDIEVLIGEPTVDLYTIKAVRLAMGLSQEHFARKAQVSFATVNRWERGAHSPGSEATIHRLKRLSKTLSKV